MPANFRISQRILPALTLIAAVLISHARTPVAWSHTVSEAMADAANAFLATLDVQQREKATFQFKEDERQNWHFIPRERNGLPIKEMNTVQRQLAYALLSSALSHSGYKKSLQIMTLEQVLHELENGAPHRDPKLYYVSIFGTPSPKGPWAWRVEGHHLSLNFTVLGGKLVAPTPSFFGSNPAEVKQGPRKGLRVLAAEEDLGRKLAKSMTDQQKEIAIIAAKAPRDIINGPGRDAGPLEPMGLKASQMNKEQRQILRQLVREYAHRLRPELASLEMKRINEAGFRQLHFAWAGGLERGEGHYYRVQGPTFMLEYDCTQNDANHVHAAWRDYANDFGEDLLKKHYAEVPH